MIRFSYRIANAQNIFLALGISHVLRGAWPIVAHVIYVALDPGDYCFRRPAWLSQLSEIHRHRPAMCIISGSSVYRLLSKSALPNRGSSATRHWQVAASTTERVAHQAAMIDVLKPLSASGQLRVR